MSEAPKPSATSGIDHVPAARFMVERHGQHPEIDGHAEEREAGDEHAGDRAGAESDLEARCQAAARGLRGPHIGPHRHGHADEAGRGGQDGADGEADGNGEAEEPGAKGEDQDTDNGDRRVLAGEVGGRALLDRLGDLLHAGVAGVGGENGPGRPDAISNRKQTGHDDRVNH